jgi:hypothetical protein
VLLDVIPGLPVEKHLLSSYDLQIHAIPIHCYPPDELMKAVLKANGLDAPIKNPLADITETVLDLLSFGMEHVRFSSTFY